MSWRVRLASFVALWLLVVGGLAAVDALTAPPTAAPQADESARRLDTGLRPGRAFVLVIDSLRYQTAVSPTLMPHLTALRARSAFARITPTRDAVTVPCLRAAFTGRDRTRVFGFVENFLKGNAGLESIFTQLAQQGRSAAVYSDGAFDQFGDRGITRLSNGDPEAEGGESDDRRDHVDEQNATLPQAIADYLAGRHDLVVVHVTYTDHVAHEVGIDAPLYAQRYHTADALVEKLDRELPTGDSLIVMGDHGHDPQGRHAVGLDVPTYALYRGPRFAQAVDLGTLSIRDHRYLLGYALGLSLPVDYGGERHANALQPMAAWLGSYATDAHKKQLLSPGVPAERHAAYSGIAALLACSFALWLRLTAARIPAAASGDRELSRMAALARWTLPGLAALAVWGLGFEFPRVRSFVHEPMYATLTALWLGLWGVVAVAAWRTRCIEVSALLLGLPLFLAVPTVYRYGAPTALGPAWLGLMLCVGVVLARRRLPTPPPLAAGVLSALLVPFAFADSVNFRFEEWTLWPSAWLPSGFLWLALLAKLVVFAFVSPGESRSKRLLLGLPAAGLLSAVELDAVPNIAQLLAALVLFLLAAISSRASRHALSTTACLTALLLLHHYAVRLPVSAYYWQDCFLAALVLSARIVRPLPSFARTQAHALLLLFAFFVSGWVSFAWTLHRLEWRFLYDFWSAAFVETHVAAFLPLLMGRFALPLLAARVVLTRELGSPDPLQASRALGGAWLLAGSKVASLMFWSYGIAFVSVASDVYLEAVQETSLACVLLLGLL